MIEKHNYDMEEFEMIIETEVLGEINYTEEDVITFEDGLYGFGGMKQFVLILNPIEGLPFHYLQSVEDQRLSFIVTSPFLFVENYDFELSDQMVEKMGVDKVEDIEIFSITVVNQELKDTTINLKAPIIVNRKNRSAKQFILNEDYPCKQLIFNSSKTED